MRSSTELRTLLRSIDHRGYPAYRSLAGTYQFGVYTLFIDHVQGDPFASPSSLHIEILHRDAGFPAAYFDRDYVRTALEDYLTRRMGEEFSAFNFKARGSGKSGLLAISRCGQEVLARSACQITAQKIIIRFHVGFPAFGRTINAGELEKILFEFLPRCVENGCLFRRQDQKKLKACIDLAEDQQTIRRYLRENDLVAFVANGSVLPRKSGVSDLPMKGSVPFISPPTMETAVTLPHAGEIRGMAVRKGITLIVGGGYHGKSTLLEALQMGVYDHIAGDGREYVITDSTAVKLRAEDGRSIRQVDISMFIRDLPNKKDTLCFSTEDASGSTSQAAGVIEGVEAGARLFLIDEDTSATNFMVRDEFMQQVVSRNKEPITPFLERARDLYEKAGVSTILVAGSSGAFFYIADTILQMDCYKPVDITRQVKALCGEHTAPRTQAPDFALPDFHRVLSAPRGRGMRSGYGGRDRYDTTGEDGGYETPGERGSYGTPSERGGQGAPGERGRYGTPGEQGDHGTSGERGGYGTPGERGRYGTTGERDGYGTPGGQDRQDPRENRGEQRGYGPRNGRSEAAGRGERKKIKTFGMDSFSLDRETVDMRYVEQLADTEQMTALAYMLRYALEQALDGRRTVRQAVAMVYDTLLKKGWEPFCSSYVPCGLAMPRIQELYACLNRFRG